MEVGRGCGDEEEEQPTVEGGGLNGKYVFFRGYFRWRSEHTKSGQERRPWFNASSFCCCCCCWSTSRCCCCCCNCCCWRQASLSHPTSMALVCVYFCIFYSFSRSSLIAFIIQLELLKLRRAWRNKMSNLVVDEQKCLFEKDCIPFFWDILGSV